MNAHYYERYKKEAGYRTFRIGIYSAIIGIIVIPYFYWLDLRDLGLTNTLPWRLLGLTGSILFFTVLYFRKRWGADHQYACSNPFVFNSNDAGNYLSDIY